MTQSTDLLHRFVFENYEVRGEVVQLSQTTTDMFSGHHYPVAIKQLLSELMVATSLLTATIKFEGSITVQLQGDGPVRFAVINGDHLQQLRGVARYDDVIPENAGLHELMGKGHMMITIIPNEGERYQGIVELDGSNLSECLESYFKRSEQLATRIWIRTDLNDNTPKAAGVLLQALPHGDLEQQALDFEHLTTLTDTLKDEELFQLSAEEILYRLFHQDDVRLFDGQQVSFQCNCSRDRCLAALLQIGKDDALSLLEERGDVKMECDYCGTEYQFNAEEVTALFDEKPLPESDAPSALH